MIKDIEQELKKKVCEQIEIFEEGISRFKVFTPFHFDDGDEFVIVLKVSGDEWIITDEGHTYMHLSYLMDVKDLEKGSRQKLLTKILLSFGLQENNGELFIKINQKEIGNAFYNFVQGLIKISDITFLNKDRVKSTFYEDFNALIGSVVLPERLFFNYYDENHDSHHKYPIDCRINGMPIPLFVHAIISDDKCRDATITLLQFEKWGIKYHSIAIFEDQESIGRTVLARFTDVTEKQFSSISNQDRIQNYICDLIK
ncbi:MAG: DUF1828 domain-containing protein [Candidatus Margulisiibacteriota bacterium]|jgi:hypothetical protein